MKAPTVENARCFLFSLSVGCLAFSFMVQVFGDSENAIVLLLISIAAGVLALNLRGGGQ